MATVLREIKAEIRNLDYELIPNNTPNQVLVKGDIQKDIFFVNNTGIVKKHSTTIAFTVTLETPDLMLTDPLIVEGDIEHISYRLNPEGDQVEQQYIISITISPENRFIHRNQHFLIRSLDHLNELEHIKKITLPTTKTKAQNDPIPDNEIIPIPDFSFLIEQKVDTLRQELEDQWRKELQSEIENQLHKDLEGRLRYEIESKLKREIEYRLREELQLKIENQLKVGFAQIEEAKHRSELEEQYRRSKRWEEFCKQSARQQLYGFKAKG